jgi:hypothetical protein
MPAMTSALMALRFSGRLMVIQRLDPRFSTRTLEVSVMVFPPVIASDSEAIQKAEDWIASSHCSSQ